VPGFGGALDLLLGEAGIVDQQLGVGSGGDRRWRGRGVAGDHDRASGSRRAHHLLRRHGAVGALDYLPPLQGRESRPFLDSGGTRGGGIEAARPGRLDQRIAKGPGAVGGFEGLDLVFVSLDSFARRQLDQLEAEAETADQRLEVANSCFNPGGP
jgi:hypothetical protein